MTATAAATPLQGETIETIFEKGEPGRRAFACPELDVPQDDLPEGDHGTVTVRYATRRGRDAADDRIRELVVAGATVVTSDRALRADVEAAGATVVGAGTLLARLDASGC